MNAMELIRATRRLAPLVAAATLTVAPALAAQDPPRPLGTPAPAEAPAPGAPDLPPTEFLAPIRDPGGSHELYLVFRGPAEQTLMDIDWIEFNGPGMMRAPQP